MEGGARAAMVSGAVRLLATTGLAGTSFSEVLALTNAPRGSIYHHFPGGKDDLIAAAVEQAGRHAIAALDDVQNPSAMEVTTRFLAAWRTVLERSGQRAGCAVLAVTVDTTSAELLDQVAQVFRAWRTRLADQLVASGLDGETARMWATTLIAATEGAVVLARAERSMEPFDLVSAFLIKGAEQLI